MRLIMLLCCLAQVLCDARPGLLSSRLEVPSRLRLRPPPRLGRQPRHLGGRARGPGRGVQRLGRRVQHRAKAGTSFSDMVQRAVRDARSSGTCGLCFPLPCSHCVCLYPPLFASPTHLLQQKVVKVLLSSGSSSGPVVYEALGILPSASFPRDGAVVSGPTV